MVGYVRVLDMEAEERDARPATVDRLARAAAGAAIKTLAKGGDNLAIFDAIRAAIDECDCFRPRS